MRRHTEDSLQRLGVPALDLTQLHCVPLEELRRGEVFATLRELQREGKIKAFGASVETVEEALVCLEAPGLASLQFIFNIFRQKAVDQLLPRVRAKGVAFVVRLPLASGLLAGLRGDYDGHPGRAQSGAGARQCPRQRSGAAADAAPRQAPAVLRRTGRRAHPRTLLIADGVRRRLKAGTARSV